MIGRFRIRSGKLRRGSQISLIRCCRRDGTGIHQRYGRNLTILDLGTFTVREVSGGMTDGERIVRRSVSCAEARSTKRSLDHGSCLHQICQSSVSRQFHVNRCAGRIYTQSKCVISDTVSAQDVRCVTDIFKSAARTSGNDTLIHQQSAVVYFIFQCERNLSVQADFCFFFHIVQNVHKIFIQFVDGVNIARVERHRDHRFDLIQLYHHHAVVISDISRIQLFIIAASSVNLVEIADLIVGSPDG